MIFIDVKLIHYKHRKEKDYMTRKKSSIVLVAHYKPFGSGSDGLESLSIYAVTPASGKLFYVEAREQSSGEIEAQIIDPILLGSEPHKEEVKLVRQLLKANERYGVNHVFSSSPMATHSKVKSAGVAIPLFDGWAGGECLDGEW